MQKLLQEGGNLILKDKEGNVVGIAEKIDFESVSRRKFLKDFRRFFISINRFHEEKFGEPVWPDVHGFYDGAFFNGSASFLFCDKISDEEFVRNKPSVGDVDLTVPESKEQSVRKVLSIFFRMDEIINGIKYSGHKESKDQILFLFDYDTGERNYSVQVDFEFVEYEEGEPTDFEQFVHNSSWSDIKEGLRGSLHKILIQAIAKGSSQIKNGTVITPKRGQVSTAKRHRNAAIYSFSVPEGLRIKYKPEAGDKYRFTPASESSRVQDVSEIFRRLFKKPPESDREIKLFHSFKGTLQLMNKYYDEKTIEDVFTIYLQKIFHRNIGMTIDRRMVEDQIPKERSVEIFLEAFPFLEKYEEDIVKMEQVFYNTTVFKEEGNLDLAMKQYTTS